VAGENIFYSASITKEKAIEEAQKFHLQNKCLYVFVFKAHHFIHAIGIGECFQLLSISAISDVKYFACVKEALVTYFALEGEVKFSDASTQKQYLAENIDSGISSIILEFDESGLPFLFFTNKIPLRESPQRELLFELANYECGSKIKRN
jgi:hypothetical protein